MTCILYSIYLVERHSSIAYSKLLHINFYDYTLYILYSYLFASFTAVPCLSFILFDISFFLPHLLSPLLTRDHFSCPLSFSLRSLYRTDVFLLTFFSSIFLLFFLLLLEYASQIFLSSVTHHSSSRLNIPYCRSSPNLYSVRSKLQHTTKNICQKVLEIPFMQSTNLLINNSKYERTTTTQ